MKSVHQIPFGIALALALVMVPAARVAADATAQQAVIAVAHDGIPHRVHPVLILEIDGVLQPQPLREVHFLAPGEHALRLGVVFDERAGLRRGRVDAKDAQRVLKIDAEAGKRYLIGAKLDGHTATQWHPVVYRVESRGAAPAP